jgi:hypothetical protein
MWDTIADSNGNSDCDNNGYSYGYADSGADTYAHDNANRVFVLDGHGQPQHRALCAHGDLAAQRDRAGCRGR